MKGDEGVWKCLSHHFNVCWAQKMNSSFYILRLVFTTCIFILQNVRGLEKCKCA